MAQRLQTIANHLRGEPKDARARLLEKHDDDGKSLLTPPHSRWPC